MKNIYLDWAALQNYLDGKYPELRDFLTKNRLILSVSHLADIAGMTNLEKAKQRLIALDKHHGPIGFLPFPDDIYDWHLQRLILRELGLLYPISGVIKNTLAAAIDSSFVNIDSDELTFEQFYYEVIEGQKGGKIFGSWYKSSIETAWRLGVDRQLYGDPITEEYKRQENRSRLLVEVSDRIQDFLDLNNALRILSSKSSVFDISNQLIKREDFFMPFFNDYTFVNANNLGFKNLNNDKTLNSTRSDFADFAHLFSLMVVDVLTVDNRVKRNIDAVENDYFKQKVICNNELNKLLEI